MKLLEELNRLGITKNRVGNCDDNHELDTLILKMINHFRYIDPTQTSYNEESNMYLQQLIFHHEYWFKKDGVAYEDCYCVESRMGKFIPEMYVKFNFQIGCLYGTEE